MRGWYKPYQIATLPASTMSGVKLENEHKGYLSFQPSYTPTGTLTLANCPSGYRDNSFYSSICPGCYQLALFGSLPAVNQNLVANRGGWTYNTQGPQDSAATFAGTEQTNAAYVMQTLVPLRRSAGHRLRRQLHARRVARDRAAGHDIRE